MAETAALADTLKNLIDVAEGRAPADMLITNVRIVDVYGHRVVGGRVAVAGGCIASVLFDDRDAAVPDPAAAEVVDGAGRYLTPGLIDGHLHIESSNIRPAEYARMALARGTTCAIADSHEIANVAGTGGLSFMIEDARRAPLAIKFMMPSCVPALPDEQAGAEISAADMRAFMAAHPGEVFGLGEMMNTPGVFAADGETLARIAAAGDTVSGLVDGHAPLVAGADLNAYAVPRHVPHAPRGDVQPRPRRARAAGGRRPRAGATLLLCDGRPGAFRRVCRGHDRQRPQARRRGGDRSCHGGRHGNAVAGGALRVRPWARARV